MAIIPPSRPGERSAEADGSAALREASPVRAGAAAAVVAAVFLLVVVLLGGGVDRRAPAFLLQALGSEAPEASLARKPAPGVDVRIDDDGYTVARGGSSLSVEAEGIDGEEWERYAYGASRKTRFGAETIVVDGSTTESFLTVSERQGPKTWRWRLETRLVPRLARDGGVSFLDPTRHRDSDIALEPVAVLDADGGDVTPEGLRWGLSREAGEWWLTLELDDSGLPLPYVIDPAADYASPLYLSSRVAAATGSWRLVTTAPGTLDLTTTTVPCRNCTGYYQWAPGTSAEAAGAPSATPTGAGWIVDTAGATGFPAGNWAFTVQTDVPNATLVAGSAFLVVGVWKGTVSGGAFTGTQNLLFPAQGTTNLRTTTSPLTTTETFALPRFSLAANERLYVEFWRRQTGGIDAVPAPRRQLDFYVNDGVAAIAHPPADDAAPAHALSVAELTNAAGQHFDAASGVHYYSTAAAGSFRVADAATDAGSGVSRVDFPAVSLAGFTHSAASDSTSPYESNTYAWTTANAASPGSQAIVAEDNALNQSSPSPQLSITRDADGPDAFGLSAPADGAAVRDADTVEAAPNDAGAGVASVEFRYCPGASCSFAAGSPIGAPDGAAPFSVTWSGQPADGVYTLVARARDNVGNATDSAERTVTVDNGDPSAVLSFPAGGGKYGTARWDAGCPVGGFCGTASDSGSGVDRVDLSLEREGSGLYWDGGSFAAAGETFLPATLTGANWSFDFPASSFPADVDYTVHVRATDAAGNVETGPSRTFAVDRAAPESAVDTGPPDPSETGDATLTFGANEAGSTFECDLDGGGFSACTSPRSYSGLGGGPHTFRVRATDEAGNTDASPAAFTWAVNANPPETTIDSGPADPAGTDAATFAFSADEPGATFECELDEGGFSPCTSPRSYASLADGSHSFRVRAADAVGNVDATPAEQTWTVDTRAPETGIDSTPADPSGNDSPTFSFSASESGASFECELDGGGFAACTSPHTLGPLADGPHIFRVRATDAAGNADATPAARTWTVDTVAPDTFFTAVPADPSNDPSPTFEFGASEAGATLECALDGGTFAPCTSPQPVGPLADGMHTLAVRAGDTAGNADASPASYTWRIDAVAPGISLMQPTGTVNAAHADPYTLRATSPDADVASVEFFRCSDASGGCATGAWVSLGSDGTAPFETSWPVDPDGNRALRAVATDAGSNEGETVVDVTIDRTRPATTIDSSPSDPSTGAATFAFEAGEAATFECELDAGGFSACTSPRSYAGLADGSHTFRVRATDEAGNTEFAPRTVSWTVDTTAPETSIDVAPGDPSVDGAPAFEFSASEAGAGFECELDGSGFAPCASPKAYAGLPDGTHTFRVRAHDAAGNIDASPAAHAWTVDATPPGGGLGDPGPNLRGTVTLSASPSDAGAGIREVEFQVSPAGAGAWSSVALDSTAPYAAAWDTTAVPDELYDLRAVVTDNAGNASSAAEIRARQVDNTPPSATMDDPGDYLRATVALTAAASDAGSGVASLVFERSPAGANAWTAAPASWDTTAVADGLYDLRAVVTDAAGNSAVAAPVTGRRVDNGRPTLTGSAPADGATVVSSGSLRLTASEDVAGVANATLDGVPAAGPAVSGATLTWFGPFAEGPHTLAGELEDLAGNRRPIRLHFTVWSLAAADYPYVEKNALPGVTTSVRATSDAATVTVPAGAWTGASVGDWLVLRVDPQPAAAVPAGFRAAGDMLAVTAYWALAGDSVDQFALPLEIEFEGPTARTVPATFEAGAWRPLSPVSGGGGLPGGSADGFVRDGANVVVLSRHLSFFMLLEDVQLPSVPAGFRGTVTGGRFTLAWKPSRDAGGIAGYRLYADGAVVRTAGPSALSAAMGVFRLSDRRSFQVAAEDVAGNVSARSAKLRVIPRVAGLELAAAKRALAARGFRVGGITYVGSSSVGRGVVVRASAFGLRRAGASVGLTVSSGSAAALRAESSPPPPPGFGGASAPPPSSAPAALAPTTAPPAPSAAPAGAAVPAAAAPAATPRPAEPAGPRTRPGPLAEQAPVNARRPLGYVLLVLAFGGALVAGLRLVRPLRPAGATTGGVEPLVLWDARLLGFAAATARRLVGRA